MRFSIDGGGGGEDNFLNGIIFGFLEEDQRGDQIILSIEQRLIGGFTDIDLSGKMEEAIGLDGTEEFLDGFLVSDIGFKERSIGV